MIYVPDNLPYSACYVLRDNYTLRVYERQPSYNSTIHYIDVALDNHYLYREGEQTFSNYTTLPVCISSDRITHAWSYRTDFADIMVSLSFIVVFGVLALSLPIKWLLRGRV